jgi:geranylgeranyl pyrophosphate synthase
MTEMAYLRSLLARARQVIDEAASRTWPELHDEVRRYLTDHALPLPMVIPLAACAAMDRDPAVAVPVAAAGGLLFVAVRWFDDAQDRDQPDSLCGRIGLGRATNMAAAALSLAWDTLARELATPRTVLREFGDATLGLARGQAADLASKVRDIDEYWQLITSKTGAGFTLAARAGALVGLGEEPSPDELDAVRSLGEYGLRVGLLLQVRDDHEGVFGPRGEDVVHRRVTLPISYAMSVDHPRREELRRFVQSPESDVLSPSDVIEILDQIDTRKFMAWAALQQYEDSLAALGRLPPAESLHQQQGRDALRYLANVLAAEAAGWG